MPLRRLECLCKRVYETYRFESAFCFGYQNDLMHFVATSITNGGNSVKKGFTESGGLHQVQRHTRS